MMPKISVIMNCFNGADYLDLSLKSVFSQTYLDWEIIFIDNCSTDNSAEIAKSYGEKVKYFKTESNIPLYEARNIALKHIEGEFVSFLDVDDLWSNDKLEKQLKLFENLEVGFVFTGVEFIDNKGLTIQKDHAPLKRGWITQPLLLRNFIAMSSSMIRASIFQKNIFNSEYNLIGDYDFWLRISTYVKADFIAEKLFFSRIHENSTTNKNKGKWILEMRRHYVSFLKKNKLKYPNVLVYVLKCEFGHLIGRY
jgi:glycosyltransferase involved in cell wall biosynthesis